MKVNGRQTWKADARRFFLPVVLLLGWLGQASALLSERPSTGGSVWVTSATSVFEWELVSQTFREHVAAASQTPRLAVYGEAGTIWLWDGETLKVLNASSSRDFEDTAAVLSCAQPELSTTARGELLVVCADEISAWSNAGELLWVWSSPEPFDAISEDGRTVWAAIKGQLFSIDASSGLEIGRSNRELPEVESLCPFDDEAEVAWAHAGGVLVFSRADRLERPRELRHARSLRSCPPAERGFEPVKDPRDESVWTIEGDEIVHRSPTGGELARLELPRRELPTAIHLEVRPSPLEPAGTGRPVASSGLANTSQVEPIESSVSSPLLAGDEAAVSGVARFSSYVGAPATVTVLEPPYPATQADATGQYESLPFPLATTKKVAVVGEYESEYGVALGMVETTIAPGTLRALEPLTIYFPCSPGFENGNFPSGDLDGDVRALVVFDDGAGPALFVGGTFKKARGLNVNGVARWDGTTWSALGSGLSTKSSPSVDALTIFDDGTGPRLYAGGKFTQSGTQAVNYVARWNGTSWQQVGSNLGAQVLALAVAETASGPTLFAGGLFTSSNGVTLNRIARLQGSAWQPLGSGVNGIVRALEPFDDGSGERLIVGGSFTSAGGAAANRIAAWSGASWSTLSGGLTGTNKAAVYALRAFERANLPALYVGGEFNAAGGVSAPAIAVWTASGWSAAGFAGLPPRVTALEVFDDGEGSTVYAGGTFTTIEGVVFNRLARLNSSGWFSPMSNGAGLNASALALAAGRVDGNVGLFVGGSFTTADGQPASKLVRHSRATTCSDIANPRLTFIDPTGGTLASARPTLRFATFDNNAGVDLSSLEILQNGAQVAASCSRDGYVVECQLERDLRPGSSQLVASIRDHAGNVGTALAIVFVPESIPPTIDIDWPTELEAVETLRPIVELSYADAESGVNLASLTIEVEDRSVSFDCVKGAAQASCTPRRDFASGPATVRAAILDLAGNSSAIAVRSFTITAPPPVTTFVGRVNFADGSPAAGARVFLQEDEARFSTTAADGSFALADVDVLTALPLNVVARLTKPEGTLLSFASAVSPVLGGTTELGTLVLASDCDAHFETTTWLPSAQNQGTITSVARAPTPVGEVTLFAGATKVGGVSLNGAIGSWDEVAVRTAGSGLTGGGTRVLQVSDGVRQRVYGLNEALGEVAEWNGTGWSPLGQAIGTTIAAVVWADLGHGPELYAGGNGLFRWNGQSWIAVGGPDEIRALSVLDGRILASDRWLSEWWNGTSWSALTSGPKFVLGAETFSGSIHMVGSFGPFDGGGGLAYRAWNQTLSFHRGIGPDCGYLRNRSIGEGTTPEYATIEAVEVYRDGSSSELILGGDYASACDDMGLFTIYGHVLGYTNVNLGIGVEGGPVRAMAQGIYRGAPALFVAGSFDEAGGQPADLLSIWHRGPSWGACDTKGVPPKLVLEPPSGSTVTGESLVVSGSSDEPASVRVDGEELAIAGNLTFSFDTGPLREGANIFLVQAFDRSGRETSLDYVLHRDSVAPEVRISAPPSGARVFSSQPTIVVDYADDGAGIDLESLRIEVEGVSIASGCAKGPEHAVCVPASPLAEGLVTIEASVADFVGNVASAAPLQLIVDASSGSQSTTFAGAVAFESGSPAAGARVRVLGRSGAEATTAADGTFSLLLGGLETDRRLQLVAEHVSGGQLRTALSSPLVPVVGGTTSAGTLMLHAACDLEFTPDRFGTQAGVDGQVMSAAVFDDGSGAALYLGGYGLLTTSGIPLEHLVRWNGRRFEALPGGDPNNAVRSLAVFDDGSGPQLYAAGSFTSAGSIAANGIARWNGAAWSSLGAGLQFESRFSGDCALGSATGFALEVFDDGSGPALFVGGNFNRVGGTMGASMVARWRGGSWDGLGAPVACFQLGGGVSAPRVHAFARYSDGAEERLFAGGAFDVINGVAARNIAELATNGWRALDLGIRRFGADGLESPAMVNALAVYDSGAGPELVAAGLFNRAGTSGAVMQSIARWNGSRWAALGEGLLVSFTTVQTQAGVQALSVYDSGRGSELFAMGKFTGTTAAELGFLGRWNGSSWRSAGTGVSAANEGGMLLTEWDGRLVAGGVFASAGGFTARNVATFDGVGWDVFGEGLDGTIFALERFDDGAGPKLYVAGLFSGAGNTPLSNIAKWTGTEFVSVGGGADAVIYALEVFDDGSGPALYASGRFTNIGGVPAMGIARWRRGTWEAVGGGLTQPGGTVGYVHSLLGFDDGSGPALYAGGAFGLAGGLPVVNVARWTSGGWSSLGAGLNGYIYALSAARVGGQESLYAGGSFTASGAAFVESVARWDGDTGTWQSVGPGPGPADILALAAWSAGDSVLAAGKYPNLARRWNGTTWSDLFTPTGSSFETRALELWDDGRGAAAYFGGSFSSFAGASNRNGIARWNGSSWSGLGTGVDTRVVNALVAADEVDGRSLYLGGTFATVDGIASSRVARWHRPVVCGDSAGPVVAILEPSSSAWTTSGRPRLRATAVDARSAVDPDSVTLTIDGAPIVADCSFDAGEITCWPQAQIADGGHTLSVTIADVAGNVGSTTSSFTIDANAPQVDFFDPLPEAILASSTPTLRFRFVEAGSGVDPTTIQIRIEAETALGFTCTYSALEGECVAASPVADTRLSLYVTVADVAGNRTEEAAASFVVDTLAPQVSIAAPRDGSTVFAPVTGFSVAFVENGSGIDSTSVLATLDGVVVAPSCALDHSGGSCTLGSPVGDGAHALTLSVADRAGQRSAPASASFFVAPDSTGPVLAFAVPADGALFDPQATLFELAWSDDVSGVDAASLLVTANGSPVGIQCVQRVAGTACRVPQRLTGSVTLVATLRDLAGNLSTPAAVSFTVPLLVPDSTPPTIALDEPTDESYANSSPLTLRGRLSESAALTVDGAPVQVFSDRSFRTERALVEGANTIVLEATDPAGNVGRLTLELVLDTMAPEGLDGGLLSVGTTVQGEAPFVGAAGCVLSTEPDLRVMARNRTTGATSVVSVAADRGFAGLAPALPGDEVEFRVVDLAGNESDAEVRTIEGSDPVAGEPSGSGTALDSPFCRRYSFVWSGGSPAQFGAADGALDCARVSVIHGRVLDSSGASLAGARVVAPRQVGAGLSLSRGDGSFDLAVNGGGQVVVEVTHATRLPVQRVIELAWNEIRTLDDVLLTPVDDAESTIDADGSSASQVGRGSLVSDSAGERRTTAYFAAGTTATARRGDGSTLPLPTVTLRATEYTVGDRLEARLPGPLPPGVDPTYVVALAVDEAEAAGAVAVEFSTPVTLMVENFLAFPVGMRLPAAYWNRQRSRWEPIADGRVVSLLAESAGLALLDLDGSGVPASDLELTALGISDGERREIAALYAPGQSLLRVRLEHFTDIYLGLPHFGSALARGPALDLPLPGVVDERKTEGGSLGVFGGLVDAENQILRQKLRIAGTPLSLVYASDRTPGRKAGYQLVVPLSGDSVPAGLRRIELTVETAGKSLEQVFPAAPEQSVVVEWNGLDVFGRPLDGPALWTAKLAYVYAGSYGSPNAVEPSFGLPLGRGIESLESRGEIRYVRSASGSFTSFDAKARLELGGWSLDLHHAVDPLSGTVHYGSGDTRRLADGPQVPKVLVRVAGTGRAGEQGDDGPARDADLAVPQGLAFRRDGTLLVADTGNCRIREIARDGTITTIAGTDCSDDDPAATNVGDGGAAKAAKLLWPRKAVEGADGAIYVADTGHRRVRRIDPSGAITTLLGNGQPGCSGGALEGPTDLAFDAAGALFVLTDDETSQDDDGYDTCDGIWQHTTNGALARVAEKWSTGIPLFDGEGLAVRPDGGLVVSQTQCLREIPPDRQADVGQSWFIGGRCHLYGDFSSTFAGDGEVGGWDPTRFWAPSYVALSRDGTIYLADTLNGRIRTVSPDRTVRTFAGGGEQLPSSDGVAATQAALGWPSGVAMSPSGTSLYFADELRHIIWKISNPAPFGENEIVVPSPDGSAIDVFDGDGHHLRTEDGTTRRTLWTFDYTEYAPAEPNQAPRKLLTQIEDAFGNVVTIERSGDGAPQSIVGPFGQTTTLVTDPVTGYLQEFSRPGAVEVERVEPSHRADGLLESLRDPNQGLYTYSWSAEGLLEWVDDPGAGSLDLSRTMASRSERTIGLASALARSAATAVAFGTAAGELTTVETGSDGLSSTATSRLDGQLSWSAPDGSSGSGQTLPDSVFGPLVPQLATATATTPGGTTSTVERATVAVIVNDADELQTLYRAEDVSVNGRTSRVTYDGSARTVTARSPTGRLSTSHLDDFGRVTEIEVPALVPTKRFYDARGRLERLEQGEGAALRRVSYTYSPTTGYLESVTDSLGRTVTFERDPVGRVTKQILPDLREIGFAYDPNGNVTSVTPPTRPAHGFDYTPVDQVEAYTPPDAGFTPRETTYAYNADRQLTTITRPDGQQILYDFEPTTGRLDKVTLPVGEIDVAYDLEGRVASVTASSGATTAWTYDGPLVTGIDLTGPVAGGITIERNAQLEVSAVELDGVPWTRVDFGYDADGLLTSAGDLTLTRRTDNGLLAATSLGTVTDSRTQTSFGELDLYASQAGGTALLAYDLDRDAAGRITKKTETIQGVTTVWEYGYHLERGWLTEVKRNGVVVETYAYDANGNRESWSDFWGTGTATHDAQDRLLTAAGTTYTYTNNGELLTKTSGSETTGYVYDVQGALTRVTLPTGVEIEYVTDAESRRIGKKVNGALVQGWIYAGGLAPIAETDGAGTITTRYVYGTRVNVPEYLVRGGSTYRIVTDHLGSVRMVVNSADGTIVQRIDYDAFGRITLDTNPGWQPFGYAGGLYDVQTGLTRFGARDYDPKVGRWTAKDPIGFAGGSAGLYEYCSNDPVNYTDPTGLFTSRDALGFAPVIGSALDAYDSARSGEWGWAVLHGALAITDLTGAGAVVKGLAVGAFKLGARQALKEVYREGTSAAWRNVRKRLQTRGLVQAGRPTHHWLFNQGQGIGKMLDDVLGKKIADKIRSHPANLMPDIDPRLHRLAHDGTALDYALHGTPGWAKLGALGTASSSTGLAVDAEADE